MPEVKIVVDGIRFTYSGLFDIDEFFKEIDKWQDDNGFEREIKKKLQHVSAEGKRMEYNYEMWKRITDYVRPTIRLKVLFRDVVDIDVEREGTKRNMQKGHVLVLIDGFLVTDTHERWWQKPWYVFTRTVYEKLFWKYWQGRHDGAVSSASYSLYNKLFAYFKRYKYY
jgi:hypothetical protein